MLEEPARHIASASLDLGRDGAARKALEVRLAEIPGEMKRESETIRARYADPEPRLFPVCVSWVFPERMT